MSGLAPVVQVQGPVHIGGLFDFSGPRPRLVARAGTPEYEQLGGDPRVWYAGVKQLRWLTHEDPQLSRVLLYTAEGAGKTHLMAQWVIYRVIRAAEDGIVAAGGATAPTTVRREHLLKAVKDLVLVDHPRDRKPGAWGTHYVDDGDIRFASGFIVQFRATKRQSAATGSPIQGYTWIFSADDELQDTAENGANADIEARLRGARVSYRMASATAKDSAFWRTFRDQLLSSGHWIKSELGHNDAPFVWPEHWARLRATTSERDYRRRVLAMDVGPERQQYHGWSRDRNLRPVPQVGVRDVTSEVLGGNRVVLVGYDPGTLFDVSILLKHLEIIRTRERAWWVVGEVTTERTTTEAHCRVLRQRLISPEFGCYRTDRRGIVTVDSPVAIVRADPYSRTKTGDAPDLSVYKTFINEGFEIKPAQYNAKNTGPGVIKREARVEMINVLLNPKDGNTRLYVAADDRGAPKAPMLVEAFESLELDEHGRPDVVTKGRTDRTHWPCGLGYGLWPYEKVRIRERETAGGGA